MNKHSFSKTKTNVAVRNMFAAAVLAAAVMPAQAKDFQIGDFDLSVNSTVSVGKSFRLQNQDPFLYGSNNTDSKGAVGKGFSNTTDDGNLNFDKGDSFSTIIKGVHDFELKKDNYGFFSRVKWFYDHTLNNKEVFHGHEPTSNQNFRKLEDSGFHPYARFDGVDVLDAFGYVNTDVGGMPLDLRLGKQVISWGESTFIFSGISGLNTLDVSALRRAGAELKEGFTPSEMLYMNLGLTDTTSLEAFYQLKWRKTVPEGCGTYYSTSDFSSDGCGRLAFAGSLGGGPDQGQFASPLQPFFTPVNRSLDSQPDDGGQFGLALRNYFQELDTEVGAYYLNYHSRLPLISLKASQNQIAPGVTAPYAAQALTGGAVSGLDGTYFIEYPEDISVFGLSFATNLGGWAWSGEVTHVKDQPIQINANELLVGALFAGLNPAVSSTTDSRFASAAPGSIVRGYDTFDVSQVQSTLIKTFDRALGASQVVFVGEAAAVFVDDLPGIDVQKYGRNAVFGRQAQSPNGYVTDFAWGYRMRAVATYRDALMGIDLIPAVSFSHDVDGWSPEPGQAFNEGRQTIGLSLGFEFDANTKASIDYVTFSDAADFDPLRDRDFLSVSASYSF
jgi:hypothetical protein